MSRIFTFIIITALFLVAMIFQGCDRAKADYERHTQKELQRQASAEGWELIGHFDECYLYRKSFPLSGGQHHWVYWTICVQSSYHTAITIPDNVKPL